MGQDQENRNFIENPGWQVIQPGEAEGRIVGGNLSTFALLRGSPYMPEISGCLLFLEDPRDLATFDRQLQGLLHGPGGDSIAGLVIGRFPIANGASPELMEHVVATKAQLKGKPVIYGVDFGHTTPHVTFPIGGTARIRAVHQHPEIEIGEH